jgi:hypothetical protein
MGIQCIASNSCGLSARIVIAMQKHATCPAKKVTTLSATRGAGLVQIANALVDGRLVPECLSAVSGAPCDSRAQCDALEGGASDTAT